MLGGRGGGLVEDRATNSHPNSLISIPIGKLTFVAGRNKEIGVSTSMLSSDIFNACFGRSTVPFPFSYTFAYRALAGLY